jgi:hypothetical protein
MKKLEDLIPFCVSTEGLTEEQGEELYNKFIKVGAAIYEGSLNKNYHWFGVDSIGDIVNYDTWIVLIITIPKVNMPQ